MEANTLQTKDFRIGNLVTDEWGISTHTVESINEKGINLYIDDDGNWAELADRWIEPYYTFESIKGIPLTEEWLLKFGFEKGANHWDNLENDSYTTKFTINHSISKGVFSVYNVELKHVHQLQNLYFALTGEELTIKE